jgi:hypothetical protein
MHCAPLKLSPAPAGFPYKGHPKQLSPLLSSAKDELDIDWYNPIPSADHFRPGGWAKRLTESPSPVKIGVCQDRHGLRKPKWRETWGQLRTISIDLPLLFAKMFYYNNFIFHLQDLHNQESQHTSWRQSFASTQRTTIAGDLPRTQFSSATLERGYILRHTWVLGPRGYKFVEPFDLVAILSDVYTDQMILYSLEYFPKRRKHSAKHQFGKGKLLV